MDDYLMLALLVVTPMIFVGVISAAIIKKFRRDENWKERLSLNPDYGLDKQPLFWLSIAVPVMYFLEFGCFAWKEYTISLTEAGFREFIRVSALPLGLLGLSLPLAALITKLHSTSQAARQIEKSKHELFYLHRKEFAAYYEQIGPTKFSPDFTANFTINPRIHAKLFDGAASKGTPTLRLDVIDELIKKVQSARRSFELMLSASDQPKFYTEYTEFCKKIINLVQYLNIRDAEDFINEYGVALPIEGEYRTIGRTIRHGYDIFTCVENYVIAAVEFAGLGREALKFDRPALRLLVAEKNCNRRFFHMYANVSSNGDPKREPAISKGK
ncbi:hypothetical protein LU680_01270 [Pseudomonas monteilii]|uniref:hypothetical protein n=1 Tax=Pseudomonas TaxID=286 RepID=UPI000EFCAD25|nr:MULTISPECIES: hypothetical protein [Pseudomonas]AYO02576.1 hypothetical protein D8767_27980 [Pseudomonas sp. LTGT-11-2Z]MCE0927909.1 hypothetical protein [Pseudomonas monteilii]MCT8188321.1 hypothetical protein [Pseudomonas monteilii]UPK83765.1 hypothetical protein E5221_01610 [Pseudomonas sp. A2]WJN88593.1 hypothetical protein LU680_01270 [Pseudomonas monteilii]